MQLKRIYAFAIGALLLGALSACAKADASAALAVSKGTEQMIATAAQPSAETASQTLRESLSVPNTVEETALPTKLAKFTISISADVSVPDTDHLSVYHVSAAEFSPELIARAFDYFCKDTTMYDFRNLTNTKEQVQGRIDSMQNDLDMNDSPNGSSDTDDSWRAEYEEELAALKAQLPTAPEDLGAPIHTAQFSQQDAAGGGTYNAFLAVNAPKYPFTVELFAWNNVKQSSGEEKGDSTFAQRSEATFSYHDTRRVSSALLKRRDVTNEPQISELITTPAQAKEQAAVLLNALGIIDMVPFRVTLAQEYTEDGTTGQYAYFVETRRVVDDIQVQSPFTRTYVGSLDGGQEWAYETLSVSLDDKGILGMSWLSPLAVGTVEVERATLLPFSSILTVAKNMLGVVNEPHESDLTGYSAYQLTIDHISLSLQRISDVDSVQNGLLIPVWNFYGTQHYLLPDGTERSLNEDDPVDAVNEAFLSVNAIDGSVISKTQGF